MRFAVHGWDRIAVVSLVIGAIVRVIWGLVIHPPVDFVYSDMAGYVGRAQGLASGQSPWRYDAFYPPGTHILLALPMTVFGPGRTGLWAAAVLWCVLSIAVAWLAWWLARQLLTPAAAAITAVFCSFYPLFIMYGGFFLSEIPSLAFMLAALAVAVRATRVRGRSAAILALLAGVLGGAAAAIRPAWLLNLVVVGVIFLLIFRRQIVPLASFALGVGFALLPIVAYNSTAAQRLTGVSENSGMVFWVGHCDVHDVTNVDDKDQITTFFADPPDSELHRGGSYQFDRAPWDQGFFYRLGWDCIEQDGAHHVVRLLRNVVDMSLTTTPWPFAEKEGWERDIAQVANVIYCALLPWIVIESVFLIRKRRTCGQPAGEAILLAHLACVVLLAVLTFGDPRYRSSYDVFGLALLAALLADRFHLDRSAPVNELANKTPTTCDDAVHTTSHAVGGDGDARPETPASGDP